MRVLVIAAVLVLTGCQSELAQARQGQPSTTPAAVSSGAQPSPSPTTASAARTSPSPPATPSSTGLPVAKLPFTCRLPVSSSTQGGFIQFPSGTYTADSRGFHGQTYDAAFGVWLPVPRVNVSPDGSRYVLDYDGDPNVVKIVDVRSGRVTAWPVPQPGGPPAPAVWAPIDFGSEGVYLLRGWETIESGIWRLNPNTGTLTRVVNVQFWDVLHGQGGVFWTVVFDPAYKGPSVLSLGYGNEVVRVNSVTGASTRWLYTPGFALGVSAQDSSGNLFVISQDSKGRWKILKVTAPDKSTTVYSGSFVGYQKAVVDGHGLWLAGPDGLYFLSSSTGFVRVSDLEVAPAGTCR